MPPDIHFDHASITQNPALEPSNPACKVGQAVQITVKLHNVGTTDGTARVRLFWRGRNPVSLLDQLAAPYTGAEIPVNVRAGGEGQTVVTWTPSAATFPPGVAQYNGCLFAQAGIDPVLPDYPGDTSAFSNWSATYRLCAQHDITVTP